MLVSRLWLFMYMQNTACKHNFCVLPFLLFCLYFRLAQTPPPPFIHKTLWGQGIVYRRVRPSIELLYNFFMFKTGLLKSQKKSKAECVSFEAFTKRCINETYIHGSLPFSPTVFLVYRIMNNSFECMTIIKSGYLLSEKTTFDINNSFKN